MNTDHVICPHCGCRCEDDEFCAACGRLFYEEDHVETPKISLLGFFGSIVRQINTPKEQHHVHFDNIEDDPDFDPSYAFFSTNIYNDDSH